jgi:uncharacterized membrane protein
LAASVPAPDEESDRLLPGFAPPLGIIHRKLGEQFIRPSEGSPLGTQQTVVATNVSYHAGPLPPAREFEAYEKAVPGAGIRILEEAAKNADHVRRMEVQAMRIAARDALLHRVLPFVFAFSVLTAAVLLGIFAAPWIGATTVFGVVGLVGVAYVRGSVGGSQPGQQEESDETTQR